MKLAVVIGSTRQNRKTERLAHWVYANAQKLADTKVELVDLRDYPMPFFDEPLSPRYNPDRQIDPAAVKWLDKIKTFDAYIFCTAEYNHSIPAVLKNALDYVTWEFVRKPAAVVSHGSAGGARAQSDLQEILSESRLVLVPTLSSVHIIGLAEKIDEAGNLSAAEKADPYGPQQGLDELLKDLKWYSDALSAARMKDK